MVEQMWKERTVWRSDLLDDEWRGAADSVGRDIERAASGVCYDEPMT
jgi:hypothetical protein